MRISDLDELNKKSNFLSLEQSDSNLDDSHFVLLPFPYERTVSYGKGTAKGPIAILNASAYVEFYDDESEKEICFEKGIATLSSPDFARMSDVNALAMLRGLTSEIYNKDKFPIILGGEHTISQAPIKAAYEKYSEMSVLQFDAHSDFRDSYEDSIYSHAAVMARVAEFFPADRITQVGIRAQCKEEADFIRANNVNTFYASAIRRGLHGANWQKAIVDTLRKDIYITFDVDYFDPSIMPATGTPEPDGFLWNETIELFREINKQEKRIIGLDIVELAPIDNLSHPDITVASLIYKILNFVTLK